jgi:glucan biosynthesis protein C
VGYFVMPLVIHDFIKWGLVFCGSLLIIVAIYMVFIRKIDLLRFLFGMKTAHPFYDLLHRRNALAIPHLIFIGLIAFSVTNSSNAVSISEEPGPIFYDKNKDIVLNISSAAQFSTTGVQIVNDRNAAEGKVISFVTETVPKPLKDPKIYVDIDFFAPAGSYIIWLRGKCESDDLYADSVWLQFDRQIGTGRGRMFGNWANIHPAHNWGWASDGAHAVSVILKYTGNHRVRIQPRQIPHKIDQIWLSWFQYSVPDNNSPLE